MAVVVLVRVAESLLLCVEKQHVYFVVRNYFSKSIKKEKKILPSSATQKLSDHVFLCALILVLI